MGPGMTSLTEKNVLELLMDWHRKKKSGIIHLERKQTEKSIFFQEGAVLRAQSSLDTEKLGQILLKRNLIQPRDLEDALKQGENTRQRLGQILVSMSLLKEPVLISTLVSQSRDIIFSLMDWEEGQYRTVESADLRNEVLFDQLYTPEIILQAMRRINNIALLLKPIGDLQGVLKLAPDYLERVRKITLLSEEKSLLSILHKPSTLNELVKSSGIEKLTVYRSAAALLAVDVLTQHVQAVGTSPGSFTSSSKPNLEAARSNTLPATRTARHKKSLLGEMLINQNLITEQQLKEALAVQSTSREKRKQNLGNILVQMGYCTEQAIVNCLSSQLKIEQVHQLEVAEEVQKLIPFNVARRYFICPIRKRGTTLEVAILDPTNMSALDDLSFLTSLRIQAFITTNQVLQDGWRKLYGFTDEKGVQRFHKTVEIKRELTYHDFSKEEEEDKKEDELALEEFEAEGLDLGDLETLVSGVAEEMQIVSSDTETPIMALDVDDAPVVKIVNTIMRQAIRMGASDIHVEPWENKLQVRFRLDGVLHKVFSFPISIANALISRIKIISQMDIAERRRPQDGRVKLRIGKKRIIDHRVSVVPSVFGERVVMRILDRAGLEIDMTKLGFDQQQLAEFQKAIIQPYGMILCTGPTGSGKTTTLYSAVNSLESGSNNIMTVEEPVEYLFPGICQVSVNEQIGVTFASVLRYFLRQDPDIIMVGEIRDLDTAETCCKAALTGHLVFSTVHTNDAPSAIGRLIDLGLKPYLISASILMIIAQRLVRRICEHCKVQAHHDEQVLLDAGFTAEQLRGLTLYRGTGCDACAKTGYYGRTAIFEIMPVSRKIKTAITADIPADQIKDIAISEGMKDLRHAALEKVVLGFTTLEEAIQNTMIQE